MNPASLSSACDTAVPGDTGIDVIFRESTGDLVRASPLQIVDLSSGDGDNVITVPGGQRTVSTEGPIPASKITLLDKFKGVPGERSPPRVAWVQILVSGITAFLGLLAVALPFSKDADPDVFMILGSFGATAALLYGAPEAQLSQPRNVIGGHVISALVGVCVYKFTEAVHCGVWLSAPLSVSLAIMIMQVTKTLHPPGAATALIAVIGGAPVHSLGFMYILTPTAVGSCIMTAVALLGNNLSGVRQYPKFWW